jgi:tRNA modification GTPase
MCYNFPVKTIVGIATPVGFGGIGIVRLSGENSLSILQKMFIPKNNQKILPRRATLGTVYCNTVSNEDTKITDEPDKQNNTSYQGDNAHTLNKHTANKHTLDAHTVADTAIAIYFPTPHSFTGENVVEIQAHGGYKLLQRIMQTAISHGCVPATNGEFTKTAFLNGKLSLDEAESIMDIINAESDAEIANAGQIMQGALRTELNKIESDLISVRANLDAYLDYPDELPNVPKYDRAIKKIITQIDGLLATAKTGQIIKNGISVAIIGKPNAGKSSLFNAIINENRSIVTDIAGTTTDTIHEQITHRGVKIKFVDTAGIHDGKTIIEKDGIARAVAAAKHADIVLVVLDSTTEMTAYDRICIDIATEKSPARAINTNYHAAIPESGSATVTGNNTEVPKDDNEINANYRTKTKGEDGNEINTMCRPKSPTGSAIIVYNKTDIKPVSNTTDRIPVSAKTGKNIDKLLDKIVSLAVQTPPANNSLVITNERHARELATTKTALSSALRGETLDMVSTDITDALHHIGAITGTNVNENTLDEIFSKFCLGK